ncbi:hypothetical protein VMCG_07346 [Cytospora schulzeri]|uniref:Rab-GAP TBC domain-containing protein n=1 Tax=Cytospora schulzeri TaxID=448051 RepID=A0A423W328_9PEZI|nr:hypothetical protein VMCG_07346 [Valsa malicola]
MAPQRFASLRASRSRAKTRPQKHIPVAFLDGTALIALPYEQTLQAQPPIPIPPPRNPRRVERSASCLLPKRTHTITTTTAITTNATAVKPDNDNNNTPAIVPPPIPTREDRPALQSQDQNNQSNQSNHSPASSTTYTDWKRDSALGTLSSEAATLHEEIENGNDNNDGDNDKDNSNNKPVNYECFLDLDDTTSDYCSTTGHEPAHPSHPALPASTYARCSPHDIARYSCQSRWSFSDSDASEIETSKTKDTGRRIVRGLSLRLAPNMKRLRKKNLSESLSERERQRVIGATAPTSPHSPRFSRYSGTSGRESQASPAPHSITSLKKPDSLDTTRPDACQNDLQSPAPSSPRPLSEESRDETQTQTLQRDFHPINTNIPRGAFLDDLDSLNFSRRGSVYFGGQRAISAASTALAPSPSRMEKSEDHAAPAAVAKPTLSIDAATDSKTPTLSTTHQLETPTDANRKLSLPNIRVMSVDTERESQKVRSLYESGDFVNWQDGAPGPQSSEPQEPVEDLPSDGDDIVAVRRSEYELAGGIEDWENVHVGDVDRYGFINAPAPVSRPSTAAETRSLHSSVGRRNGRNVLVRRTVPSSPLSPTRVPSRKVSARSLNTQTSGVSTSSRRTARSGIRSAVNMLPYHRDRRIIEEAGDMLSPLPGLEDKEDEQRSEQITKASQEKEIRRTEKWRRMAKIITKGTDGNGVKFAVEDIAKVKRGKEGEQGHFEIQGMDIEFDTKNPKLVERTWKGIPDCWRSSAWYSFLAASANEAKSDTTEEHLFAEFHRLQDISSSDDLQIDLDVPRTINKHIMFRKRYRGGQRLLFRVLHALSLHFPDTGYVQGMAALAASLLCYYDEERCFVMLVRLWQFRGLERMYEPGFAGLMTALQDLETNWLDGKPVAKKLFELGIDPTAYGTRWYLTLFNLSIPFPAQLRVWDVFMLLGGSPPTQGSSPGKVQEPELTFPGLEIIHAASAALIDAHKEAIIGSDFENAMKVLTSTQRVDDVDYFMSVVRAEWNTHRKKRRG